MLKFTFLTWSLLFISYILFSQNVGVGTAVPHSSAVLELKSSSKGFLIPRLSSSQRNGIVSPAKGLVVFDSSRNSFWFHTGTNWKELSGTDFNADSTMVVGQQSGIIPSYNIPWPGLSDSSGFIYDSGGPLGNYGNNENIGINLLDMPNQIATDISIISMNTESPNDSLEIKDAYNRRYVFYGTMTGKIRLYGQVSINFKSNSTNTQPGFQLRFDRIYFPSASGNYDSAQLSGWYFNKEKLYMRGGLNARNLWSPDSSGRLSFSFGRDNKASGENAIAFGYGTIASGNNSIALGVGTTANGSGSMASGVETLANSSYSNTWGYRNTIWGEFSTGWGSNNSTDGHNSTIWGHNNWAEGHLSTAWGVFNESFGENSTVWGKYNSSNGNHTTVWGYGNYSSGVQATAWGEFNSASGRNSTAFGTYNSALAENSTAAGNSNNSTGTNSFAAGLGNFSRSFGGTVIGMFNDTSTVEVPATSSGTNRLFQIGNGSSNFIRRNAMTVLQNGNVGIGIVNPTQQLEVANNITVQNGKGLIRSTDGTQQKKQVKIVTINTSLLAGETKSFSFTWNEPFGAAPDAYVGAVAPGSAGGWAEVVTTVAADNTTGGTIWVFNPRNTTANLNFNIKIIGIGAQ